MIDHSEMTKGQTFDTIDIVQFGHKNIVVKSIINKPIGNLSIVAIDTGLLMERKPLPFDTYIQVLEGLAKITIGGQSRTLKQGQSIIIPARIKGILKAVIRLKVFMAIIKTGNELLSPEVHLHTVCITENKKASHF